jgi:hypothetical protein
MIQKENGSWQLAVQTCLFYARRLMNFLGLSRHSQRAKDRKNQRKLSVSDECCKLLFYTFKVLARMKFARGMCSLPSCNNRKPTLRR